MESSYKAEDWSDILPKSSDVLKRASMWTLLEEKYAKEDQSEVIDIHSNNFLLPEETESETDSESDEDFVEEVTKTRNDKQLVRFEPTCPDIDKAKVLACLRPQIVQLEKLLPISLSPQQPDFRDNCKQRYSRRFVSTSNNATANIIEKGKNMRQMFLTKANKHVRVDDFSSPSKNWSNGDKNSDNLYCSDSEVSMSSMGKENYFTNKLPKRRSSNIHYRKTICKKTIIKKYIIVKSSDARPRYSNRRRSQIISDSESDSISHSITPPRKSYKRIFVPESDNSLLEHPALMPVIHESPQKEHPALMPVFHESPQMELQKSPRPLPASMVNLETLLNIGKKKSPLDDSVPPIVPPEIIVMIAQTRNAAKKSNQPVEDTNPLPMEKNETDKIEKKIAPRIQAAEKVAKNVHKNQENDVKKGKAGRAVKKKTILELNPAKFSNAEKEILDDTVPPALQAVKKRTLLELTPAKVVNGQAKKLKSDCTKATAVSMAEEELPKQQEPTAEMKTPPKRSYSKKLNIVDMDKNREKVVPMPVQTTEDKVQPPERMEEPTSATQQQMSENMKVPKLLRKAKIDEETVAGTLKNTSEKSVAPRPGTAETTVGVKIKTPIKAAEQDQVTVQDRTQEIVSKRVTKPRAVKKVTTPRARPRAKQTKVQFEKIAFSLEKTPDKPVGSQSRLLEKTCEVKAQLSPKVSEQEPSQKQDPRPQAKVTEKVITKKVRNSKHHSQDVASSQNYTERAPKPRNEMPESAVDIVGVKPVETGTAAMDQDSIIVISSDGESDIPDFNSFVRQRSYLHQLADETDSDDLELASEYFRAIRNKTFLKNTSSATYNNATTSRQKAVEIPPIDQPNTVVVYKGNIDAPPNAKITIDRALMTQTLGRTLTNKLLGDFDYQKIIPATNSCYYVPPPTNCNYTRFDSDEENDTAVYERVGTLRFYDYNGIPC